MTLHEALAAKVTAWRLAGYECEDYPAVAEILEWAHGTKDSGNERFLRAPQLRALETYWYLRLVENTPHILALYRKLYGSGRDLLEALGLTHKDLKDKAIDLGIDGLIDAVRTDDALVKKYKLEALRETLNLDYPSYILALAMGAGKTILIGGHLWLEESWEQPLPKEMDDELAAVLMVLGFFASRKIARSFAKEARNKDFPGMAESMREMFPDAIVGYAVIGGSIRQALENLADG